MTEPLEPDTGEPLLGFEPGKIRGVRLSGLAVRFAFGAGISLLAAGVAAVLGPHAGGMFLAFPAILPASLTLLEQQDGHPEAAHDQRGALLGAVGMVAFALVAALTFSVLARPAALAAATVAWVVAAVGTYLLVARHRRATGARTDAGPGPAATAAATTPASAGAD